MKGPDDGDEGGWRSSGQDLEPLRKKLSKEMRPTPA